MEEAVKADILPHGDTFCLTMMIAEAIVQALNV